MAKLSNTEVEAGLGTLPGWRCEGDEIVKDFELATFPAVIDLVVRIGELAEAADHHPDLDIRYTTLHVALTSHDAGGLTAKDLELAAQIEAAVGAT